MKTYNLKFISFICMVSAMGGLLFGYDWVVIGGAKPFYEAFFDISNEPAMQGWAMSSALVGCLFGALLAGIFSDRYGRKKMLIGAAALFVLTGIGTGAANSFSIFIVYRIIGGFAIGIASNLSPMYIAEVSPAPIRGKFVSLNQLTIVLGILGAQIVNWLLADVVPAGSSVAYIASSWNGLMGWRWMFWAEVVPAFLFLVLVFFIPESPRWLAQKGRMEETMCVLEKIHSIPFAKMEYASMLQSIETEKNSRSRGGLKMLLHPSMRKVMVIGIVLAVFQQWCGINVIFNYAQEIFSAAGYGVSDMLMNIVITGITNVVFTFVAIFLVDRVGRRPLLLFGAASLAVIYLLMGAAYCFHFTGWSLLVVVIAAIACYAMSLAPVMWVVISEIFPNAVRGAAIATATFALWAACFILTYTFPILNDALGAAGTFWIYGGICLAGYIFIFKMVPETKGKSLEEIEHELIYKEIEK